MIPHKPVLMHTAIVAVLAFMLAFIFLQLDHLHHVLTQDNFNVNVLKMQRHEATFQQRVLQFQTQYPEDNDYWVGSDKDELKALMRTAELWEFPLENEMLPWAIQPSKRYYYQQIIKDIRRSLTSYKQLFANRSLLQDQLVQSTKPLHDLTNQFLADLHNAIASAPPKARPLLNTLSEAFIQLQFKRKALASETIPFKTQLEALEKQLTALALSASEKEKIHTLLSKLSLLHTQHMIVRKFTHSLLASSSFDTLTQIQKLHAESLSILQFLLQAYSFLFYFISICVFFATVFILFKLDHTLKLLGLRNQHIEDLHNPKP